MSRNIREDVRKVEAFAPKNHELAYITPKEAGILKLLGGSGKVNPATGIREYDVVGYYGPNVATTTNVPGVSSSVSQGPPGSGPGSQGNVNVDPADDWISTPQSAEVYYGPGGQGTTNVNITDPSGGGYDAAAAAQAAAAQAAAAEEEKKKTLAKQLADKGKEIALAAQSAIMGGPAKTGIVKPAQQPGKHKLRAQYDYLLAKYGDKWAETTQAKSLANYLSGVPVEQGGGLGALDSSYGTGEKIDPTDKAEIYRQEILDKMMYGGGGHSALDYLKSDYYDAELAKQGLTPEQYFNFRQQLMAADPSLGNVDYKEAFPLSSGSGVAALASPALSITKDILGIESVAPAEYQENIGQTFYDTSTPEYGGGGGGQGGGGGAGISGFAGISPLPGLVEDNLANIPAEVAAATVPAEVAAATEPTPFDYSQWPQFTSAYPGYNQYPWPNYVNQGLGQWPNFDYWNQIANAFPGMSQYG